MNSSNFREVIKNRSLCKIWNLRINNNIFELSNMSFILSLNLPIHILQLQI